MIGDGDLETIFASDDFATDAVFTITAANPPTPAVTLTVRGFFTGQSDDVTLFGQVQIEAQKPSFTCETADLETAGKVVRTKMSVVIDTVTYIVERIEKVGTGVSVVYLKTT